MLPFSLLLSFIRKLGISLHLSHSYTKPVPIVLLTFHEPSPELKLYLKNEYPGKIIYIKSLTKDIDGWITFRILLNAVFSRRPFLLITILYEPVKELFFSGFFQNRSDLSNFIADFSEIDRLRDQSLQSDIWERYKCWINRELKTNLKIDISSKSFRFNTFTAYQLPTCLFYMIIAPATMQDTIEHLTKIISLHNPILTASNSFVDFSVDPSKDPVNFLLIPFQVLKGIADSDICKKMLCDDNGRLFLKYGDFDQDECRNAVDGASVGLRSPFPNYLRREVMKNKFWYVDIPRTSSSSLKVELGNKFGLVFGKKRIINEGATGFHIFPNHVPASLMIVFLGEETWRNLFTFSLTRNPWDRILSLYHYRRRIGNIPEEMTFREYVFALHKFRGQGLFSYHGFYYSNADYICDAKGRILVSYWGKYEDRNTVLKTIGSKLDIENLGNLHLQSGKPGKAHYSEWYDTQTRNIIESVYHIDIERFEYSFETN